MPTMLQMNSFDTICHEHLEYYSLAVIERLFAEAGLEVVRAELNDVNGGSIRLFAGHGGRHGDSEHREALEQLRASEAELALDTVVPYEAFGRRVRAVKDDLLQLLRCCRSAGERVHIYGASTKGNTLLQYVGLDTSLIECAADRNEDKWGSETIGTHIPIVSEEESRGRLPDYYLALPWHFLPEFLERETDFLGRGGKFIVPLPDVHVVPSSASKD
jgi:NDP-4-keto-2,6-dideoxyhexose 3-C-methyltransferase